MGVTPRLAALAAAVLLSGSAAAPVLAQDNEDLASPIGVQCLSQKIHRDHCYCLAQYIRMNGGEYIDSQIFVRLMKAYFVGGKTTIGPDLHRKVPGDYEAVEMAAKIMTDGTEICSQWSYTR